MHVTATSDNYLDIIEHPCFNNKAYGNYGRIHLPVSPICNIQCRFCKRSINKYEHCPGVSTKLITPEESINIVKQALKLCPKITVVGIAGPGESLASDHALRTFKLIKEKYPNLLPCLSTNGLLLKENFEVLATIGVKTLTVTINAVTVNVLEKICNYIFVNNQCITGSEAAYILINKQLEGIMDCVKAGIIIKVNTVLIPGINDRDITKIAATVSKAGASFINIIPLIPRYELKSHRAPNLSELEKARKSAGIYLPVFRRCMQCRADACGIHGSEKDFAHQLYI